METGTAFGARTPGTGVVPAANEILVSLYMSIGEVFRGRLFAEDFLAASIVRSADWSALDDVALDDLEAALRTILDRFPIAGSPNESQTEDDLIWPVLHCLARDPEPLIRYVGVRRAG